MSQGQLRYIAHLGCKFWAILDDDGQDRTVYFIHHGEVPFSSEDFVDPIGRMVYEDKTKHWYARTLDSLYVHQADNPDEAAKVLHIAAHVNDWGADS